MIAPVYRASHAALCLFLCVAAPAGTFDAVADLYSKKDYAAARDALALILAEAGPDKAVACRWMSRIARRQKQPGDAIRWIEEAIRLEPRNATFWVDLGDAYGLMARQASIFEKLDWAKKCDSALTRAVELAPSSFEVRAALVDFCREAPEMAGGGRKRAFEQVEQLRPLNPGGAARLAVVLYERERDWEPALAACRAGLAESPASYELAYTYGRTAALAERADPEALKALERCLGQEPPAEFPGHGAVWFRIGDLRRLSGDAEGARQAYRKALEIDPSLDQAKAALEKLGEGESKSSP